MTPASAQLLELAVNLTPDPAGSSAFAADFRSIGDRVVFSIANGNQEHTVVRSDDPQRFDRDRSVQVSGSYVDRLEGDADLVFYRID